ncbi:MAG TPA: hypothetical protein VHY08_14500 [Bacillota bacterium]|nr:hypothetical protein [Bacillota bacterium]
MSLWEFVSKNILITITGVLVIGTTVLELCLNRKINRTAQKIVYKYPQEQILALLIEKGGKMNRSEISNYLDWPIDLVMRVLLEMEKEEIISQEGVGGESILLKKNDN